MRIRSNRRPRLYADNGAAVPALRFSCQPANPTRPETGNQLSKPTADRWYPLLQKSPAKLECRSNVEPNVNATDLKMDPADLYHEEVFTDRKMGTVRRLTPVTADGSPDKGRSELYVGQAQLLTPMGAVPVSFEISAGSLDEAIRRFPEEAKKAVDRTVEELKELRRQASSSIVVPQAGPGGSGDLPGGGKIQIP